MKLKIALPLAEKSSVFSIIIPLKSSNLEEYLRVDFLLSWTFKYLLTVLIEQLNLLAISLLLIKSFTSLICIIEFNISFLINYQLLPIYISLILRKDILIILKNSSKKLIEFYQFYFEFFYQFYFNIYN